MNEAKAYCDRRTEHGTKHQGRAASRHVCILCASQRKQPPIVPHPLAALSAEQNYLHISTRSGSVPINSGNVYNEDPSVKNEDRTIAHTDIFVNFEETKISKSPSADLLLRRHSQPPHLLLSPFP